MVNAFVTNGKYSSIAVISVPSALRKRPDTASITCETILLTQVTIPSNIQSSIIYHLLSARPYQLPV